MAMSMASESISAATLSCVMARSHWPRTLSSWNNSVIDRDTMLSYVAVDAAKDPQPEVHLRANPRVRYEYVADVLFAMQRGGLKKIGFLTGQGEAPPAE